MNETDDTAPIVGVASGGCTAYIGLANEPGKTRTNAISEDFAMHPPARLNDLTREQLAEIQARSKRKPKPCLYCAREVDMRPDQHFCCDKCRTAYNRAAAQIAHDELVRAQAAWRVEREALIREIQDLKRRLGEDHV